MVLINFSRETSGGFRLTTLIIVRLIAIISIALLPIGGNIYTISGRPTVPPGKTIYYKEGATHIVEVLEDSEGTRHLILDGGVSASTASVYSN
jgi:uncharacterized membrane protein YccF (DUF307 family)